MSWFDARVGLDGQLHGPEDESEYPDDPDSQWWRERHQQQLQREAEEAWYAQRHDGQRKKPKTAWRRGSGWR